MTPRPGGAARFLSLAVGGALLLRIAILLFRRIIEEDGAYYASLASALLRGDPAHGVSTAWPPLYPALIALVAFPSRWFGATLDPPSVELAARVVSALAGGLLLIPLYFLARALLPERFARIAVILAAVHPRLLDASASTLTESTYMLLLVTALAVIVRNGIGLFPGLTLGAAFLVRPEALIVAGVIGATEVLGDRARPRKRSRLPLFLLGLLLAAGPYLLFLHERLGTWSLGEKGAYNFWRAYRSEYGALYPPPLRLARRMNESPELAAGVPPEQPRLVEFVLRKPGLVAGRALRQLATILFSTIPVVVYHPWALLALLGLGRIGWPRGSPDLPAPRDDEEAGAEARGWLPIGMTMLAVVLLYAPISVDRRFLIPLVPLFLLASARGIQRLDRKFGARGTGWLVAGFGVLSIALSATQSISTWKGAPLEHREAGLWLARHTPSRAADGARPASGLERPTVVSRKPWVAYYAGALIKPLPEASLDRFVEEAQRNGGDYLVADDRSARGGRPVLGAFLDPRRAPAGWVAVHVVRQPSTLVLYALPGRLVK